MARRSKSSNKNTSFRSGRDHFPIARRSLPLTVYEDRRLWNPVKPSPARAFSRRVARIVEHNRNVNIPSRSSHRSLPLPATRFAFSVPRDVIVCVRRKVRKEVIHASGRAGRRGQRRPRRNEYSDVRC